MKLLNFFIALFAPIILLAQDSSWRSRELSAGMQTVLGEKPDGYYLAGFVFSVIGILFSLYHSSKKRNPASPRTPDKFSWYFLIWDNIKRACITLVLMFVIFRVFDLVEVWQMIGVGIGVAAGLDKIIELIMNKWDWLCKVLSQDRTKLPTIPTDAQNNQP